MAWKLRAGFGDAGAFVPSQVLAFRNPKPDIGAGRLASQFGEEAAVLLNAVLSRLEHHGNGRSFRCLIQGCHLLG